MTRPRVYLAGPIAGLNYDGACSWRNAATDWLADHGVSAFSPMRNKPFLNDGSVIDHVEYTQPLATPKGLTTRDRNDTMRADVVLINLLGAARVSIGTMIEVGWADAARVPIVLVMEPGNIHWDHPMLSTLAGYVVPTLEEGLAITRSILTP